MATIADTFQVALAYHRAGQPGQTERICRQILADDPHHAEAAHMLGIVAYQAGRPDLAIPYMRQAIALQPVKAAYHCNLGEAYRVSGELEQAKACFQEAIRLQSDLVGAHYNLGLVHQSQGELTAAQDLYVRVLMLAPGHADAHNNLGNVLRALGESAAALEHYRQAIACRADFAEAHNNLGNLWLDRGEIEAAIDAFEQALRLRPNVAETHYNLANALRAAGRNEQALAAHQQAVALNPKFALAHNNLGTLQRDLGNAVAAESAFRTALACRPDFPEAWFNLGVLLQGREDLDGAQECYGRALALRANHAEAHYNLGVILQQKQQWDAAAASYRRAIAARVDYAEPHCNLGALAMAEGDDHAAISHFERALAIRPDCAEVRYNRGMLDLRQGRLAEGWAGYECRFQCASFPKNEFAAPAWDGSFLAGRSILIHAEQGLGDTLQFVRYLPLLSARGAGRVGFVPLDPLERFLHDQPNLAGLFVKRSEIGGFDVQASLLSLPRLFQTKEDSIPSPRGYLQAHADLVEKWRGECAALEGVKVGICWQGNPSYAWDCFRSIQLREFEPLARLDGVRLICLQQGPGREQMVECARRFEVIDFGEAVDRDAGPFRDTAAIMRHLDLVVTSDTAVAHLAGAMGVRVWLALSRPPEWRWGTEGQTSPWYPTMRVFRQRRRGEWSSVFAEMKAELRQFIEKVLAERRGA